MNLFEDKSNKTKSFTLNKKFIDEIISNLNEELKRRNKTLEITVYGGSCLCILDKFRESTYDIDLNSSDNALLKDCVNSLGYTKDLINTEMEVFINLRENLELYKILSNLKVFTPALDYLLALKLKSAREKDLMDCVNLCKDLELYTIQDIKHVFCRYYSVVQFSSHRKIFCNQILNKLK